MGACKACGEVYGAADIKDGLCPTCIKKESIARNIQPKSKDNNPNLKLCEVCGNKISVNARICPHCGEEYIDTKKIDNLEKEFAKAGSKSRLISFILTALFGPLGLLYTSFKNSIMMIFMYYILGKIALDNNQNFIYEAINGLNNTGLLIIIVLYFVTIWIGDNAIVKRRLLAEAKLMTKN